MKYNSMKMWKPCGIFLCFAFIAGCVVIVPGEILAGGADKEITGNRGYFVGGPSEEGVKAKEKAPGVKRQRGKLELLKTKAAEVEEHIKAYEGKRKTVDHAVPGKKGDIAPKGYLVGTPKEKPAEVKKKRGAGGFADGWNKAMGDLKEFNRKIRRPYPADQSLEGTKGGYIYGEAPAEGPEPEREIARTRGFQPLEFLNVIGKGVENLHKTWQTRPHRSTDKEIWGFAYPDMPKKEKPGITRHRGNPVEIVGSCIEDIEADIEKRKAAAPVDK